LISAVFVVVVLGSIGAYVVSVSGVQHTATALSIQAMRAYFAARSGLEWAAFQATTTQTDHDNTCGSPATTTAFTINTTGLNNFQVTVVCDDSGGFEESGALYEVDAINVNATSGSFDSLDLVSRICEL